jgi:hypothetical protein
VLTDVFAACGAGCEGVPMLVAVVEVILCLKRVCVVTGRQRGNSDVADPKTFRGGGDHTSLVVLRR